MIRTRTGLLLALTLVAAGTAPALAEVRYATDPDPAIYNTLAREHIGTYSHQDAVLPRTHISREYHPSARAAVTAPSADFESTLSDRAKGHIN